MSNQKSQQSDLWGNVQPAGEPLETAVSPTPDPKPIQDLKTRETAVSEWGLEFLFIDENPVIGKTYNFIQPLGSEPFNVDAELISVKGEGENVTAVFRIDGNLLCQRIFYPAMWNGEDAPSPTGKRDTPSRTEHWEQVHAARKKEREEWLADNP